MPHQWLARCPHGAKGEHKEKDKFDYFASHPSTTERAQCPEEELVTEAVVTEESETQSESAAETEVDQTTPVEAEPLLDTPLQE